MGKRARFRGVKRTSKRVEGDILEMSGNLWSDASLLRPQCAGDCRKCHFDKSFKKISKLDKCKHSGEVLEKMATKGTDDLFKAYAGTISLYAYGNVPYTATAKIAGEDVLYVPRGAVGNDKLIGCQHYDDPKLRLFLYNVFAKKKNLTMYSYGDDLVCSNHPNMPEDYVYDTFWETPYQFLDDGLVCGHNDEPALVIHVKSTNVSIRICRKCAKKEVSSLQYLISRMISNNPLEDVEVYVEHNYISDGSSGREDVSPEDLKKYSMGGYSDQSLLNMVLKAKLGDLKSGSSSTYIIGTENYGSDYEGFISALKGEALELKALSMFLPEAEVSIVIQSPRASEALSSIWDTEYHGILSIFASPEVADMLGDVSKKNPLPILKEAERMEISKDVVKTLPSFKYMGQVGSLADRYAKSAKAGGFQLLKSDMERFPPRNYWSRALAKAFAIAVGDSPNAIKTTNEEADLAEFLIPFVKALLDANASDYQDKMNTLLTATGCGETVR